MAALRVRAISRHLNRSRFERRKSDRENFCVSLDDFVGEQQERIRDIEPHRLGSLEVHDQFVACGQLEGQFTRLRTLENFIYQSGRLAVMSGRL